MSDFLELVQSLQLALKARAMYTGSHPRAQTALANLHGLMTGWLNEAPSLHVATAQNKLFLDGSPFEGKHLHLTALSRQFSERQISGIIFQRGVEPDELDQVLEVLQLKPSRIEEAGGVAAILARKNLPHIQLSQVQYKEIREGEGGEEDHDGPPPTIKRASEAPDPVSAAALEAIAAALKAKGLGPTPGTQGAGAQAPQPQAKPAFNVDVLVEQWKQQFALLPPKSLLEGPLEAANLGFLGGTPSAFGMGETFPPSNQMEGLRRALLDLPAEQELAVVAGLESLPAGHQGMRMGFQALAPECFAHAAAALMEGGSLSGGAPTQGGDRKDGEVFEEGAMTPGSEAWERAREAMFSALRYAPQGQAMLQALEGEMRGKGAGLEQLARLQELIQQLDWENQSMEEKLRQVLEQDRLWALTLDQRLRFMRRLLDEGRIEGLLAVLEMILEALRQDNVAKRAMAAQTLTGVTRWLLDPGLPVEAEGPLVEGLTAHFGWEPLAHIHRSTAEALGVVVDSQIVRGEPGHALTLLQEVDGLVAFQDKQEWRTSALAALWEELATREHLQRVADLLHTANAETMLGELIPYFDQVGQPAARALVEILGDEPDRKRRGRLLEAIRCMGAEALPAVYEGLGSPAWYLVRNALNLLAEIGDANVLEPAAACLAHPDGRVKRAAVRTMWKLGGPAAVTRLLAAFPTVDPGTQEEMMFGLGQVRAIQAVPVLAAFAMDRKNGEKLRVRAAETIGQIGDPRSIPVLAEMARRKGMIFTSAEPLEVRLAACRSLLALDAPGAKEAVAELVAAEPWHKDRSQLQQVLDAHRGA